MENEANTNEATTNVTNVTNETNETVESTVEETPKKRTKSRSLATLLLDADVMAEGIASHPGRMTPMGMGEEYATEFKAFIADLRATNATQEKLKAQQKEKTAELVAKQKELRAKMKHSRSAVKTAMPMELWKEFGIQSTR